MRVITSILTLVYEENVNNLPGLKLPRLLWQNNDFMEKI